MKVRNGEIRAEKVLVEGDIKLAFVDWLSSEGAPYHNHCNHRCLSQVCVDSGRETLGSM